MSEYALLILRKVLIYLYILSSHRTCMLCEKFVYYYIELLMTTEYIYRAIANIFDAVRYLSLYLYVTAI